MFAGTVNTGTSATTTHRVVLPFYVYAAVAFFFATILLMSSADAFSGHYFHPHLLAITHIMALGWGTMIILGAGHQLVPVLIESKLYSNSLAHASFALAAAGIPLLGYGFYYFDMDWPSKSGGILVIGAIVAYIINLAASMSRSKRENVHAVYVFTATVWLLLTAILGLMLVYNFTLDYLPAGSLHYLPMHAHMGIAGWFLLLIIGVGSRLIPMFLISKYDNPVLLWWVYGLINGGLVTFIFLYLFSNNKTLLTIPIVLLALAIVMFVVFCSRAYKERIRKKLDDQMRISLLSVLLMIVPVVFVIVIICMMVVSSAENIRLVLAYGFVIFFGWITAIILGMTFKTLPFIIWNKVYHDMAGKGKTPNPKDLFSSSVFRWMGTSYLIGFTLFVAGIFAGQLLVLQCAAGLLVVTSLLYNIGVVRLVMHKAKLS